MKRVKNAGGAIWTHEPLPDGMPHAMKGSWVPHLWSEKPPSVDRLITPAPTNSEKINTRKNKKLAFFPRSTIKSPEPFYRKISALLLRGARFLTVQTSEGAADEFHTAFFQENPHPASYQWFGAPWFWMLLSGLRFVDHLNIKVSEFRCTSLLHPNMPLVNIPKY